MKVFVLFPKAACYDRKDTVTQRQLSTIFNEKLSMLVNCGCTIQYLLEDKLAHEFISKLNYDRVECVTGLPETDYTFLIRNTDEDDPLEQYVFNMYNTVQKIDDGVGSKNVVDPRLLMTDKEQYYIQRKLCYKKRRRDITDHILKQSHNVLVFRAGNVSDRSMDATQTIAEGDGRLVIQVDLQYNTTTCYYGGVFIPSDMVGSILSL